MIWCWFKSVMLRPSDEVSPIRLGGFRREVPLMSATPRPENGRYPVGYV